MTDRREGAAAPGREELINIAMEGFTREMRLKLGANDHKGPWTNETLDHLVRRLLEEVIELVAEIGADHATLMRFQDAVVKMRFHGLGRAREIQREAADVGNFAMMIWERFS
jgi:hypothetical protein